MYNLHRVTQAYQKGIRTPPVSLDCLVTVQQCLLPAVISVYQNGVNAVSQPYHPKIK